MEQKYPFSYLPLPYAYDALEPVISSETLHYHHDRHYKTYVDNLNKLLENAPNILKEMTLPEIIEYTSKNPAHYKDIYNNAGGVYNHRMYFESMVPAENNIMLADDKFYQAVKKEYGSVEDMLRMLEKTAVDVFGSGYAWLCKDSDNDLVIIKTANQDNPLSQGLAPLLPIDVWEHAYYLDYRNVRKNYVEKWLGIIDWEKVSERYRQ